MTVFSTTEVAGDLDLVGFKITNSIIPLGNLAEVSITLEGDPGIFGRVIWNLEFVMVDLNRKYVSFFY